jgi:hypothetical protein
MSALAGEVAKREGGLFPMPAICSDGKMFMACRGR